MSLPSTSRRTSEYKPALAWFAALSAIWVFGVVTLGAFTTSIDAGMAFPDWPLSNGSINPDGWLSEIDKFAEHSHRLFGTVMGLLAIGLVVWLQARESRAWLRRLAWFALAIVIVQGVLGGKRVLLDTIAVPGFEMSLGQMLRIPHGILAHVYGCLLFAIAAALSRRWTQPVSKTRTPGARVRQLAIASTLLVLAQLVIAAVMRHNLAGLAIPTFPLTPEGGIIPGEWNYHVAIHFAHRVMACVLGVVLIWFAVAIWRDRGAGRGMKDAASALTCLLVVQIFLGAASVWSLRHPGFTTAQVVVGAIMLATTFTLGWWCYRDVLEDRARAADAAATPDTARDADHGNRPAVNAASRA